MKNRKVFFVTAIFFVLAFAVCVVLGFFLRPLPELIASTVGKYCFFSALKLFCTIVPVVLGTGLLIGWLLDFGAHSEGSRLRFSAAMFSRYKTVLIDSLIAVLIISLAVEAALPGISRVMERYCRLPSLQREYLSFASGLYEQERFGLSYEVAKIAYGINPSDKESAELLDKAEIACKQLRQDEESSCSSEAAQIISSGSESAGYAEYGFRQKIAHTEYEGAYTTYSLLQTARDCFQSEDWFGAHYYAQTALAGCAPRDINVFELKQIAAAAWKQISQARREGTTDEQQIFARKLAGYNALMEQDNLKAYYIFRNLSLSSKKTAADPDVVRYLSLAENRLQNQYFFIDETLNLQGFESASAVRFKIAGEDGSETVYFVKGVTNADDKNVFVQYLRGLSVFKIDSDGNYISGFYSPYAKMTSVSADLFDDDMKKQLGIADGIHSVPYILLHSVDRNREGVMNVPDILKGDASSAPGGFLILPMEFTDFSLIKDASGSIDSMSLDSLFRFISSAEKYGFVEEVFQQALMSRLLYPLLMLIFLVCIGICSWHGRLRANSVFKFKWIIVFPLAGAVIFFVYRITLFLFRLVNYSLIAVFSRNSVLLVSLFLYLVILFCVSLVFLGCKDSMDTK